MRLNRRLDFIRSVLNDERNFVIHAYNRYSNIYGTAIICDDNTIKVHEENMIEKEYKTMSWNHFQQVYKYYVADKKDRGIPDYYFTNNDIDIAYKYKENLTEEEFLRLKNAEEIAFYVAKYNRDFQFKGEYVDIIACTLCPYLSKDEIDIPTLYQAGLILKRDYHLNIFEFPFKYSEVEQKLQDYNQVKMVEDYYKRYKVKYYITSFSINKTVTHRLKHDDIETTLEYYNTDIKI